MFTALTSLSFATPWVLALLSLLPVFYWLIRITPPRPKSVTFSAVSFLLQLPNREDSTVSIPWWLLLLRLLIATLIILALSGPRLNAPDEVSGDGPVVVLVENDWAAAPHWEDIEARLTSLLENLKGESRLVYLVPMASIRVNENEGLRPLTPDQALEQVASLQPVSWHPSADHLKSIVDQLSELTAPRIYWISDGAIAGEDTDPYEAELTRLSDLFAITLYTPADRDAPVIVGKPTYEDGKLNIPLTHATDGLAPEGNILIKSANGSILTVLPYLFEEGSKTTLTARLPISLYNEIDRIEVQSGQSAASLYLIDSRSKRKTAGIVISDDSNPAQALLSEVHYLEKALQPHYSLLKGNVEKLVQEQVSVIFLGDGGISVDQDETALADWVRDGGTLVRFAGPRLANSKSELTPVRLREGSRNLDGSISWTRPQPLGAFGENSPFANLTIPEDVTVKKQILALPTVDLSEKTWASLADGTPLVTADVWEDGNIILFHTSATPSWSNLVLSGLFVDMLKEIGSLSRNSRQDIQGGTPLPPYRLLDGFGRYTDFKLDAEPLDLGAETPLVVSRTHPAGFYGTEQQKVALNIGDGTTAYKSLSPLRFTTQFYPLQLAAEMDMVPILLTLLVMLILIDLLLAIYLQGKMPGLPGRRADNTISTLLIAVVMGFALLSAKPATAQSENLEKEMLAALDTRLAYILTGDLEVDRFSAAGLAGLSLTLTRRTSVETEAPLAINIERDELLFYPFVYWPVTPDFPELSTNAIRRINQYLKEGGTILFDTRNQHLAARYGGVLSNSPENLRLQKIVARLQIPQLVTVPVDHVLTRSFYLMQSFPGRYETGNVWISSTEEGDANDGVSPILIGSNDWAAAWALDENGRPMASVIPGGERQRELAWRFGINLAMYTLTGSYKADQVHIPAILNRLSQ
ncbi:DUF4159 domain-containing protein [Sneathiella limimaris]|uniref:DUF4159 domain-containing protein n=1 Tax=Sneathiella limimaris TaxID=1964213 RepID=UPI00146EB2BC|nr:DUF4159 domain-containing protein [Sneathiella limimaris]